MAQAEDESSSKGLALHVDLKHLRGTVVPNLGRTSLKFKPNAFMVESSKLDGRIVEAEPQWKSYQAFAAMPTLPMTYICSGNPDDVKARFFAAHLAGLHARYLASLKRTPHVVWEQVLGGFDNPVLMQHDATMIVLDNLSAIPNKVKYDKVRDVIARFPNIPKVLVVAGEDPVSFAATRIYSPAHGIAYFPASLVKATTTLI